MPVNSRLTTILIIGQSKAFCRHKNQNLVEQVSWHRHPFNIQEWWQKNNAVYQSNELLESSLEIKKVEPIQPVQMKVYQSNTYKEAVVGMCSIKKFFSEISQKSQKNTCARVSFFKKLQVWGLQLY